MRKEEIENLAREDNLETRRILYSTTLAFIGVSLAFYLAGSITNSSDRR